MANLGLRWLLRSGLQVLKETISREAIRPVQKPIHPKWKVEATEPILRNQQFASNQLRRVLIGSRPHNAQVKYAWETLSCRLRNDAVRRLFSPLKNGVRLSGRNGKSYLPFLAFGFVGLALTESENNSALLSSDLISDSDFDALLRSVSKQNKHQHSDKVLYPDNLDGYSIDDHMIGKGSFGAIYPAKIAEPRSEETRQIHLIQECSAKEDLTAGDDDVCKEWEFINKKELIEDDTSDVSSVSSDWSLTGLSPEKIDATDEQLIGIEGAAHSQSQQGVDQLLQGNFNLAIKIIFNDKVESNSALVEVAFQSEKMLLGKQSSSGERVSECSAHPNIVRVHQAFVGENISERFSEAKNLFPYALPRTRFKEGWGRNLLMYVVMHRYEMTLREYLERHPCQTEERAKLMLCQLLEGAAHLRSLSIAHRDIKDDNILVEQDSSGTPRLAIADFGCALFGEDGLQFRVPWYAAIPTGNSALQAPEIKTALQSGSLFVDFDYRKSDGWALGAVAYQICGLENPFYQRGVDSLSYDEQHLPSLKGVVSPELEYVIHGLLRKDPIKRLSCVEAADMVHLLLWKPDQWMTGPVNLWKFPYLRRDLHQWFKQMTPVKGGKNEGDISPVKSELLTTFFSRAQRRCLLKAAKKLILFKWERWVQGYVDNMNRCVDVAV